MMNKSIARALNTAALLSAGAVICSAGFAQTAGDDAAAAKSMLQKAVAAVKADKAKAIETFNKGEGGFYIKDRDLFPFCFTKADGKIVATQTKQALGKDVRTFKDKSGKAFGQEIYNDAKDGQISEVNYTFGKPGAEQTPVPKVSFVTGVADLGCAVGYYK
jgi:signal transduction histidine kinase